MKRIGLFYGPLKGSTEKVAFKVAEALGNEYVDVIPVKELKKQDVEKYDYIVFGIATIGKDTWDLEHHNTDWDDFLPELRNMDLTGKKVAMFGLGDNLTYSALFVDALGVLAHEVTNIGGAIVGQVDPSGYDFEESKAIVDGKFVGLPVNEDYEPELTDERVKNWVNSIKPDFGL